ncbi:MAG TPA: hypothetical protein VIH31_00565 [Candidatus Paceibacterota bacterium]
MKIITDNKKFSLLVAFLVVVVFVVSFSNSPGVAQAPDSNLATVDAVNGQVVSEGAISAPLVVQFRPSLKLGTTEVYLNYNILVKENDEKILEFNVNIETKISTPDNAVINWSGVKDDIVTVTINDPEILAGHTYTTQTSAINDITGASSAPLFHEFTTKNVVPTVQPESLQNNVVAEQGSKTFFERIRRIIDAVTDFFGNIGDNIGSFLNRFTGNAGGEK